VADVTRALIGQERDPSGHYAAVMPTGRLQSYEERGSEISNDESQLKIVRESKFNSE